MTHKNSLLKKILFQMFIILIIYSSLVYPTVTNSANNLHSSTGSVHILSQSNASNTTSSSSSFVKYVDYSRLLVTSDFIYAPIAVTSDNEGNCYIMGQSTPSNGSSVFIAKLNSTGDIVFTSFFGGNAGVTATAIAVDSSGNSYITGETTSQNFPTKNAYQTNYGGNGDAFIAKFSATGKLEFSTYFGGAYSDKANGIALDGNGNIFIVGTTGSNNFPKSTINFTTGYSFNVFVAKFTSNGVLVSSIVFGGQQGNSGIGIAVDANDNVFVTGTTRGANFPTKNAFMDPGNNITSAIFITEFNSTGNMVFSTCLFGNRYTTVTAIALDKSNNVFVTGYTEATTFPTKNAFNATFGGYQAGFLSEFNAKGSLVFSTFLSSNDMVDCQAVAVDSHGNAYVEGHTDKSGFPTKNALNATYSPQGDDNVLAEFNGNGKLLFSTYMHKELTNIPSDYYSVYNQFIVGMHIDSLNNIYMIAHISSKNGYTRFIVTKFSITKNNSSKVSGFSAIPIVISLGVLGFIFSMKKKKKF